MKKTVAFLSLLLVMVAMHAYADSKISALLSGGNLQPTDEIPIVRSGANMIATLPSPTAVNAGGTNAVTAQAALNNLNNPGFGSAAYVVAPCTGFNDQVALATAEAVAYNTKTAIVIPTGFNSPGNPACQIAGQWQLTHPFVSVFSWPQGPMYDSQYSFNNQQPTLRVNSGSVLAGTTNNCAIDINGQASVSFTGINIRGDAPSTGTAGICNTVNGGSYANAHLATLNLRDVSIDQFFSAVGCAGNDSTGACTGTLGNNVITVRAVKSVFYSDDWAFDGNLADLFAEDSEFITKFGAVNTLGFDCNCDAGLKFLSNRVENSGTAGSGFGQLTLEGETGEDTIANNQFIQNQGPAIWFKVHNSNYAVTGNSFTGNGIGGVSGEDADIVFGDTVAGSGHSTFSGNDFVTISGKPKYAVRFDGTSDDYLAFMSNVGGSTAYATSFFLFNTETPAHLISDNIGEPHLEQGRNWAIGKLTAPNSSFDLSANTDALSLPSGTSAQRPSPAAGMVRYNADNSTIEAYLSGAWTSLRTGLINLASQVTGSLPIGNGGTGAIYAGPGGTSDDCPAIQTAINAAETAGNGVVTFNQGATYTCSNAGLTFDPTQVSFEGNGTKIDATTLVTGPLFTVTQTSSLGLAENLKNSMRGFYFSGPTGGATTIDLFVFNTTAGNSSSKYSFKNITANGFRHDEVYENGAYLVDFDEFTYQQYKVSSIYMPDGFSNYGENITHGAGVVAQGPLAVDSEANANTNTFRFVTTSFDNNVVIAQATKGLIEFVNPHFELSGTSNLAGPILVASNNSGASIRISGGDLLLDGSGPFSTASALFEADGAGTIDIDNMFMHNTGLTSGTYGTGTGLINITRTRGYATSLGNASIEGIGGPQENYMADGGFENASPTDLIFISSDTQTIVNRLVGGNVTITDDSATCGGHSGSKSLRLAKAFGSGSNAVVYIAAPVEPNKMVLASSYWSVPTTQTGTVNLNLFFLQITGFDGNGLPVRGQQSSSLGNVNPSLSGTPITWTKFANTQSPSFIVPYWANYIVEQVNMNSMNAGSFCIDDFVVNTM